MLNKVYFLLLVFTILNLPNISYAADTKSIDDYLSEVVKDKYKM